MKKLSGKANSNLYKRGDAFWVRYTKDGRTLQKSLDTENVTDARMKRDVEIAAFMNSKEPNWKGKKLTAEYFNDWLGTKSHKSDNTKTSMRIQWEKHLKPFFGHMAIEDVTETMWSKYVDEKRKTAPDRKFFNDRKYFSMFMGWALREGFIDRKPFFPDVDPEPEGGKVFDHDQIINLFKHAKPELRFQITLALLMGMRRWEILSLEWWQIDFIKKTLHLPAEKTKIRKARTFPIASLSFNELVERKKNQDPESPWVFPNPHDCSRSVGRDGLKSAWGTCRDLAGLSDYKFHWLRHTFLTRAFKTKESPALICAYAGLSMDVAQRIYLHFTTEDLQAVKDLVSL